MGSNAANDTCQIWISKQVHAALKDKIGDTRRYLRAEAEQAIAIGLGFKNIQDLEQAYPLAKILEEEKTAPAAPKVAAKTKPKSKAKATA